MSDARQSHEAKTTEERRRYFQTNIARVESPTAELRASVPDSTEAIAVDQEELTGRTLRPIPTVREGRVQRFLREKGFETLVSIIVIGGATWLATQVFSMNREDRKSVV